MDGEPSKVDVFGVGVSLCTVDEVSQLVLSPPMEGRVVVIGNVHSIMTARRDPEVAAALRGADVLTPDGMPLVWAMKVAGYEHATRVTGIDVMKRTMELGVAHGTRHFLYGSTPNVLAALFERLRSEYPDVIISGAISPPFRKLSPEELGAYIEQIVSSESDVVWVGLGMPKQELWMNAVRADLSGMTMVGVGAAFDWLAGSVPRAPEWMQRIGLEWLYRLLLDPRRLWRRYVLNNPPFMGLLAKRWAKVRFGRTRRKQ